jgi:hypothetical protein
LIRVLLPAVNVAKEHVIIGWFFVALQDSLREASAPNLPLKTHELVE